MSNESMYITFRRSYGNANYRPQHHWHYSNPEVLFRDLRRDEIRGWWWWWWWPSLIIVSCH